ncbi:hypothetical protein PMAYCL1PPCAC_33199, partial [Pristionchus mayeri]
MQDNGTYVANLGFLQDHHVYRVHLKIPRVVEETCKIIHEATIVDSRVSKSGPESEIMLSLRLDGIHGHLQSILTLDSIEIAVRASVLKSQDGTPSLKRGVSIVSKLERSEKCVLS